jgi:hypothetical protein
MLLLAGILAVEQSGEDWFRRGKCKGLWRSEKLPGRCTGLHVHSHEAALAGLDLVVHNATQCRALCCNLGDKCVSWQFEVTSRECKVGPVMRLGDEDAGVPGWCDPHPPVQWNGKRVKVRETPTAATALTAPAGAVIWDDTQLKNQCFGLGDERKDAAGGRLNTEQCAAACASDLHCGIWQEFPGRGCFYHKGSNFCETKQNAVFVGGRKCISGYCGGNEPEILGTETPSKVKRQMMNSKSKRNKKSNVNKKRVIKAVSTTTD